MTPIRIILTRTTVLITIAVVLILPISFLVVSYLFQDDVVIDKPKTLEELAKSLVALLLSLTGIIVSNAFSRKEINRKASALRYHIQLRVSGLNDLLCDISANAELLGTSQLVVSSAEVIRKNYENKERFKTQIKNLNAEFEQIQHMILSADPEVGIGCLDYTPLLSEGIIAIRDYLAQSSVVGSERIKLVIRRLVAMNKQISC